MGAGAKAIVDALRTHAAQPARRTPWMTASALAGSVGVAGPEDLQFIADVQMLFADGVVQLMSGGQAGGGSFYEAMLVTPRPPDAAAPGDDGP